jgi:hypothetical protein
VIPSANTRGCGETQMERPRPSWHDHSKNGDEVHFSQQTSNPAIDKAKGHTSSSFKGTFGRRYGVLYKTAMLHGGHHFTTLRKAGTSHCGERVSQCPCPPHAAKKRSSLGLGGALGTHSKVNTTRLPLGSSFLSTWILQSIIDMIPSPNC